ncbi:MAG: dTDP-glucose 4,6-dehydratase [Deltaproteobacteria bacterium RBG_13_65_10]|nr:MAG: dTDP-glucose 4,6-dehydratase [Deltaproteobacteria bacterium RBG_13_65_10]
MKILVTGGAGFIGSNFIRYFLASHSHAVVTNLDLLTYAGNLENLADVEKDGRYRFVKGDIVDTVLVDGLVSEGFDVLVNFAAESHVDRSIESAAPFIRTNVMGTQVLLDAAIRHRVHRFVQISTDEVYGSLPQSGAFREDTPLHPNSPYAASKAGADLLVLAGARTHGLDAIVTRCSNNYGPYQFPEKLIPLFISNALEGKPLPVYGDGLQVRDWLHVDDHNRAINLLIERGQAGEVYNIGAWGPGAPEWTNLEIAKMLLRLTERPEALLRHVTDRPGHDRRYAMDYGKIAASVGWRPKVTLEEGLTRTVRWYVENRRWWEKVKSGEYRDYYRRLYGNRL